MANKKPFWKSKRFWGLVSGLLPQVMAIIEDQTGVNVHHAGWASILCSTSAYLFAKDIMQKKDINFGPTGQWLKILLYWFKKLRKK